MTDAPWKAGQRIRLTGMPNDPHPIPPGTTGTIRNVTHVKWGSKPFWQISVQWDINRSLTLCVPPDSFTVIG